MTPDVQEVARTKAGGAEGHRRDLQRASWRQRHGLNREEGQAIKRKFSRVTSAPHHEDPVSRSEHASKPHAGRTCLRCKCLNLGMTFLFIVERPTRDP